jgi:MFS family permease
MSTIPKSTLVKFYGDIINQPSTLPFISGAMPVGAIFGSLLANIVMRFFTRRYTFIVFRNFLIFVNIIAIGVNIIIQITNIYVLLICRLITGVLVGLYLGIVPTYIN